MSDIFREVEEEVRRERLEKFWKDYSDYIIAAAALLVLAVAGYRLWTYYDARERARASGQYMEAMQLLENGQAEAAAKAFARLNKDAPSGYAKLSQLQAADALLASGKKTEAVALYRKIAADDRDLLAPIARIRAGWALVESAPRSELEALLGPLTAPSNPWHAAAREILAYSDYRHGDTTRALTEFRQLSEDPTAPAGLKQRASSLATFIAAGGDRDVGTVPPPPQQKPVQVKGAPKAVPPQPARSAHSQGTPSK